MFLHILFFTAMIHSVFLDAGWKEQVEKYAPTVLGSLIVPIAVGTLYYPFTKSKSSELKDLDDLVHTIEDAKEELTIIQNEFSAAPPPDIKNENEREEAKKFINKKQDKVNPIFRHLFKEDNKDNKYQNPLWRLHKNLEHLKKYITQYDDLLSKIGKKVPFGVIEKLFAEGWKHLPSNITDVNDMFDRQLEEINEKKEKITRARFWPFRRFLRPYAGYSTGNIIVYLLTTWGALQLGPATVQAIMQKIKHR